MQNKKVSAFGLIRLWWKEERNKTQNSKQNPVARERRGFVV
jgi:hypothetical protein